MPGILATGPLCRLICALALSMGGLNPVPGYGRETSARTLAWPLTLRLQMLRLNEVEWNLRTAAGGRCRTTTSATGLAIDYLGAYDRDDRTILHDDLRMTVLPQIAAVAGDSPAALAGIKPGDQIVHVHGIETDLPLTIENDPKLLAEDLTDWFARQPAGQPITIDLRRDHVTLRKTVRPVPLCAGRVVLKTDDALDAYSDDENLAITTGLVDFTENDDELALIVGHELAHLILRQPQGGSGPVLRDRETEADILGAALAHCAGYDVVKGAAFWPRYRDQDAARSSRLDTHSAPGQRQHAIIEAAAEFSCPVSLPAQASSAPR